MNKLIKEKFRNLIPRAPKTNQELPKPLPTDPNQRLVRVFVEGYEDVAFWRGIFDHFMNPRIRFEISVPVRHDLPKGKKVLMGMIPKSNENTILCVDSDFDFLFGRDNPQSQLVNDSEFMFHTYTYATENYLCYAPSLHNVCVKATKNDTHIFDFVHFLREYSRTIYPMFLWYALSASRSEERIFLLADFKNCVRLDYLDINRNGANTILWLRRKVARFEEGLHKRHPDMTPHLEEFEKKCRQRGVTPENVYLYMHGHTLMDNVVMVLLTTVCEKLRQLSIAKITSSSKHGVALKNEISNYTNTQRSIRDVLLDNENYTNAPLYKRLRQDIEAYISKSVRALEPINSDKRQSTHATDSPHSKK